MFDSWNWRDKRLTKILHQLVHHSHLLGKIMATQAELAQALTDLGTQLDKVTGEIQAEVKNLEDEISNAGASTPAVDAALASLKAKVQALDDMNPDTPAAPAPAPAPSGDGSTGTTPTDDGSATTQS